MSACVEAIRKVKHCGGSMTLEQIRNELRRLEIATMPIARAFEIQDRLPPPWRKLIYEHGQVKVFRLLQHGASIHQARRLLS